MRALVFSLILCLGLAAPVSSRAAAPRARTPTAAVDLNTATPEALVTLPGVGPVLARRIVAERNRRRLRKVADLLRVKGIGKRTLARLEPFVVVKPAPQPTSTPGLRMP